MEQIYVKNDRTDNGKKILVYENHCLCYTIENGYYFSPNLFDDNICVFHEYEDINTFIKDVLLNYFYIEDIISTNLQVHFIND